MEYESTRSVTEPETATDDRRASVTTPVAAARGDASIVDPAEHNTVFLSLVTGDQDIVGLVAYSIYKQNKYDWLMAFSRHQGRMPNADEVQSYLFGESTPRRLATYRHLAEATLDGRGLEVPGSSARSASPSRPPGLGVGPEPGGALRSGRPLLIGLIVVILVAVGLLWFFHGGSMPPPK